MNFWWIRHGPTHAKTMVGWTDLDADLSDLARLERLAALLPKDAPVISSDLRRAARTADAIAAGRPRLAQRPALRELNFGQWDNRDFVAVEAEYPDLLQDFWNDPGDAAPPDGESWNAFTDRVNTEVARLAELGHDDLIVVAHFGVILTQIQRALGLTAMEAFAHHVDCLSLTQVRYSGNDWQADMINHLP